MKPFQFPKPPETLCEAIGTSLVSVKVSEAQTLGHPNESMWLTFCTPSGVDDGAYYPAESVQIYSLTQITKLRDLLDRAIAIAHKWTTDEPVVEAINQVRIEKQ